MPELGFPRPSIEKKESNMKRFILDIVAIVIASVTVNWIMDIPVNLAMPEPPRSHIESHKPLGSAIKPHTMTPWPTPYPTATIIPILVANKIGYIYETIEQLQEVDSDKYSDSYKRKLREQYNPGWLEREDKYKILDTRWPYAKIEIIEHKIPNSIWRQFRTIGWVKF